MSVYKAFRIFSFWAECGYLTTQKLKFPIKDFFSKSMFILPSHKNLSIDLLYKSHDWFLSETVRRAPLEKLSIIKC